jgi:hypothetical protein
MGGRATTQAMMAARATPFYVERQRMLEDVLKAIRKTLVAGKSPWLANNIDATASTCGPDDTDEG